MITISALLTAAWLDGEQAKAKAVLRRQMRHVLFTEPADIQAGGQATIYYNPADTLLSGTQQVFLTVCETPWCQP